MPRLKEVKGKEKVSDCATERGSVGNVLRHPGSYTSTRDSTERPDAEALRSSLEETVAEGRASIEQHIQTLESLSNERERLEASMLEMKARISECRVIAKSHSESARDSIRILKEKHGFYIISPKHDYVNNTINSLKSFIEELKEDYKHIVRSLQGEDLEFIMGIGEPKGQEQRYGEKISYEDLRGPVADAITVCIRNKCKLPDDLQKTWKALEQLGTRHNEVRRADPTKDKEQIEREIQGDADKIWREIARIGGKRTDVPKELRKALNNLNAEFEHPKFSNQHLKRSRSISISISEVQNGVIVHCLMRQN